MPTYSIIFEGADGTPTTMIVNGLDELIKAIEKIKNLKGYYLLRVTITD
jgi:hypothetical protein